MGFLSCPHPCAACPAIGLILQGSIPLPRPCQPRACLRHGRSRPSFPRPAARPGDPARVWAVFPPPAIPDAGPAFADDLLRRPGKAFPVVNRKDLRKAVGAGPGRRRTRLGRVPAAQENETVTTACWEPVGSVTKIYFPAFCRKQSPTSMPSSTIPNATPQQRPGADR